MELKFWNIIVGSKMKKSLKDAIHYLSLEDDRKVRLFEIMALFSAIAKTAHTGRRSDHYDFQEDYEEIKPNKEILKLVNNELTKFIKNFPNSLFTSMALQTKAYASGYKNKKYFLKELERFYQMGNAGEVYTILLILEDMGEKVWLDEKNKIITSRSCNEAEKNMGVARRYIKRTKMKKLERS